MEFTKVYNKEDGSIGRKKVRLTNNISYIEPCKIKDRRGGDDLEIDCTKVFYAAHFLMIELTVTDFLIKTSPEIKYL